MAVALDIPGAQAAGLERNDRVVEAREATPVLGDQRRIELVVPVARN